MASKTDKERANFLQSFCPFHDHVEEICRASASRLQIGDRRRQISCLSDDYDSCPFYLARILRRMRPKYHASRCQEIGQK